MFKYDDCNKRVVEECLKAVDQYRGTKSNNMFDAFYHSHLDCFVSLIEDWKKLEEDSFAVIMCRKGHKYEDSHYSPVYATVCKKPHWDSEGIMLTGGFYDATKFDLASPDLYPMLKFINNRFPDKEFEVIVLSKGVIGDRPKELWSIDSTRGDFDETGEVAGAFVKEVG